MRLLTNKEVYIEELKSLVDALENNEAVISDFVVNSRSSVYDVSHGDHKNIISIPTENTIEIKYIVSNTKEML